LKSWTLKVCVVGTFGNVGLCFLVCLFVPFGSWFRANATRVVRHELEYVPYADLYSMLTWDHPLRERDSLGAWNFSMEVPYFLDLSTLIILLCCMFLD